MGTYKEISENVGNSVTKIESGLYSARNYIKKSINKIKDDKRKCDITKLNQVNELEETLSRIRNALKCLEGE